MGEKHEIVNPPQKSVGAVFDAALESPPEQRAAYLAEACARDEALRQRVEALLRAHETAGAFMERPAVDRLPPVRRPLSASVSTP
jgi:hypothetical protein